MSGGEGRRAILVAIVSTVVFFTLVALAITHAPGWPEVRRTFFDWKRSSGPFRRRVKSS